MRIPKNIKQPSDKMRVNSNCQGNALILLQNNHQQARLK